MSVRIRLTRQGTHKRPYYRVVVAEKLSKRDGAVIEQVGIYDPLPNPAKVELKADRIRHWLSVGAQPSDTVRSLIKRHMPKDEPAQAAK